MQDVVSGIRKQLGQLRPANTSAAALYTLASGTQAYVTMIVICNTTALDATYSIYNDTDGTTYTEATALVFSDAILANETIAWQIPDSIPMFIAGGTIGVRSGTNNAITFTAYGIEKK